MNRGDCHFGVRPSSDVPVDPTRSNKPITWRDVVGMAMRMERRSSGVAPVNGRPAFSTMTHRMCITTRHATGKSSDPVHKIPLYCRIWQKKGGRYMIRLSNRPIPLSQSFYPRFFLSASSYIVGLKEKGYRKKRRTLSCTPN